MDKTYEKISDTEIRVTESVETVIDIKNTKIEKEVLVLKKSEIEKEKQGNMTYYDKQIADIQSKIDKLDVIISEAEKIGVNAESIK